MLFLHIGMPKTGTTALQNFLRVNTGGLSDLGLHYMTAGRSRPGGKGNLPISHNRVVFDIAQGGQGQDTIRADIAAEYEANCADVCLVSSEMLYTTNPADYAPLFSEIAPGDMCITFFCRSYDGFFEADYKQRSKNGKAPQGTTAFVRQRLDQIHADPNAFNFSGKVAQLRSAFPAVKIVPRIYDRSTLVGGNVIDDFFDLIGLPMPEGAVRPDGANSSLSRAGSDAFGILTRLVGKKMVRRLRRDFPPHPVMQRRNDVLEPEERAELNAVLADSDAAFLAEFFPQRATLFAPTALSNADQQFRRDTAEERLALQHAAELVFGAAMASSEMMQSGTATRPKTQEEKAAIRERRQLKRAARAASAGSAT